MIKRNCKVLLSVIIGIVIMCSFAFATNIATESVIRDSKSKNIFANLSDLMNGAPMLLKTIIVLLVVLCIYKLIHNKKKPPQLSMITKSELKKILDIDEISVFKYPYTGIAKIYKEDLKEQKNE